LDIGLNSTWEYIIFWSAFSLTSIILYVGVPYGIVFMIARLMSVNPKKAHTFARVAAILGILMFVFTKLLP
jgi:hypothetical protein